MKTIEELIDLFYVEFDDVEPGSLKPNTDFRSVENWGSMHALIIIALVDTEFDVTLTGTDLRSVNTIQELYNLIKMKS